MFRSLFVLMLILIVGGCDREAADDTAMTGDQPAAEAAAAPLPLEALDMGEVLAAAINNPKRSAADKEHDIQRMPVEVLAFAGVQPAMTVLDLFAGGGWFTEVLSLTVGEQGVVWAQNPPAYFERFGDAIITQRLADKRLPNVIRWDRSVDAMELPENTFDFVVAGMIYHDLHWLSEDVNGVLTQIHAAMKPGALFLITDHAAPEGTGAEYAMQLEGGQHRIEEAFAIQELETAGFELVGTSDLLRVPEDDRTRPFFLMDGAFTDRFVLLLQKPVSSDG